MEDVNWLLKKWGFPILMLLIAVIAGSALLWKAAHGRTEGGRRSVGASG